MSFQDKRRKELGLTGTTDFQTRRMMDLGMIPDTRPKPEPLKIRTPDRGFDRPGKEMSVSELMRQSPLESFKKNWPTTQSQPAPIATSPVQQSASVASSPQTTLTTRSKDNYSPEDAVKAVVLRDKDAAERLKGTAWEKLTKDQQDAVIKAWRPSVIQERRELQYMSEPGIVRDIHKGLDRVADLTKPVANVAMEVYTPGAGLSALAAGTRGAEALVSRALPGLGKSLGGKVAKTAATEAIVGAPATVGNELAKNPEASGRELGIATGIGGVGGAGLGAAGRYIWELASKYLSRSSAKIVQERLALPAPRERGNVNRASTPDVITDADTRPVGLPEPSEATMNRYKVAEQVKQDIQNIDAEIKALNDRYEQAVIEEYNYLKTSLKERGGVKQGNLLRNAEGEVIGRMGRQSENPQWYRDYYAEHGRVPSNKELYRLARERVDSGYQEEGLTVPSWKVENQYDDTLEGLQRIREILSRDADPTAPLGAVAPVEQRLSFPPKPPRAVAETTNFPTRLSEAKPEPVRSKPDMEPLGISAFAKQEDYGIKNPKDTRSHIVTKTGGEKLGFVERVKRLYEKAVNNVERLNAFDKYVEEVTGKKLSPQDRAHVLALNQRGADMIANVNLTEALVDAQGNVIGKSLKDITKNIPRRRMVDFEDYVIAKHAQTRMARGERVYAETAEVTPEKLADKIKYYERQYPEFARIADELYDYLNKLGEAWLVDTGIISRETWNQWRQENPFWIPMKREFKDIEYRSTGKAKRGFFGQNSPVKAYSATGSERKIISPIESMIEYVDSFVKTAKRNEVMQSVVRSLKRDPEALKDFAEVIPAQAEDMGALLRGEDGMEQILNSINEGFEKAMQKPDLTKGNVVSVLNNGKREYVKVNDPAFLEALTNLSPQTQSAIINATGKVTNVMKVLTTGINPVFSLTRNIFYDIPQAFAFSKTTNNPIRFAWDLMDGVISTFGNRELYRSYKAMGGGHSSSVAADRNLLAQSKRAIMPQRQKANLIRKAYAGLENLANVIESAPRLGEFKRITKAGGNTYDSRVKGLFEAQDVTTNFKRYGNVTKQADAIFPYLNAAIQGMDKNIRAFKDNPVQVGLKAFGAVTIPTVALYALNYNNPKYKKLSNYTKDRFFLIPTTDDKNPFIKIPKPREIGIPFGALVERSLRLLSEEDPEAFRGFADQVRIAFAPPGISAGVEDLQRGQIPNPFKDTIMGPLMELESNRNFAGAPIVPGYLEGVSPRHQHDANTSELSKKIGDVLNVSPKQIDHLIRSYGGVIGQVGIPATSQGSTFADTMKKQITADPVFSTDASTHFYDLKDKLDRQYKDIGVTGEVPKGYNDGARKYLGKVASTMSDITKQIREVDKSNLPREQKLNRKRELTEMRNELAREAYRRVIEALQ